jgi:5-methylcytosine-specific restriction enzyme A
MGLRDLTKASVEEAVREFDALGQSAFLGKYGFGEAKSYFLERGGNLYDSKAVAGAAHGYMSGQAPLRAADFTGGEASVARVLRNLGFAVVNLEGNLRKPLKKLTVVEIRAGAGTN